MRKFFSFRPFIDVLFCCLLMLVAILFLLKTEEEKTKSRPPNVIYEIVLTWDGDSEDDLDIYVQAASGHKVYFNNREGGEGSLISLDHDALGKRRNNSLSEGQEGTVVEFNEEIVSFLRALSLQRTAMRSHSAPKNPPRINERPRHSRFLARYVNGLKNGETSAFASR